MSDERSTTGPYVVYVVQGRPLKLYRRLPSRRKRDPTLNFESTMLKSNRGQQGRAKQSYSSTSDAIAWTQCADHSRRESRRSGQRLRLSLPRRRAAEPLVDLTAEQRSVECSCSTLLTRITEAPVRSVPSPRSSSLPSSCSSHLAGHREPERPSKGFSRPYCTD